ncbi:hypothetical protein AMELA_G00190540 [Ameiurus melas]|uniref:Uncharacterized protein n=1 Tax=Ameiurus melas TaxID=219545 RepID=A0A7J6AB36_AMEME|nr:hypothetical protein AMELA_G00190540 [Ameiurus melas]
MLVCVGVATRVATAAYFRLAAASHDAATERARAPGRRHSAPLRPRASRTSSSARRESRRRGAGREKPLYWKSGCV